VWEKGDLLTYTGFNEIILRAARETALKSKKVTKEW
jgi:hypothetical protein